MTKQVKNLVIGFGKAGKTLAAYLGNQGESTVLVEKSPKMYGGTCINVGCIPSKSLATAAMNKTAHQESKTYYEKAVQKKKMLIQALNQANYDKVAHSPQVSVVDGVATFVDEHTVAVETASGRETYRAERIFINTGATPFIPKIDGLTLGKKVHTSETLMDVETLPESLAIIGSGFIGLEFASTYAQFGSKVTVIDAMDTFLPREDADVANAVQQQLEAMGITVTLGVAIQKVIENDQQVSIVYETKDGEHKTVVVDAVLVATGRKPNVAELQLERAGVLLDERGAIRVNEFLQTNHPHIFALGDVNGGPQFTFISLDDFRIVKRFLSGQSDYSTKQRAFITTATFINPPLASVGLNEKAAAAANIPVKVATLPMTAVPKAKILENSVGLYKVLVHAQTGQIVGATLFAPEAHEVINIIATAMKGNLPYTVLRDQIFTHPTMVEALNDVFGLIQ